MRTSEHPSEPQPSSASGQEIYDVIGIGFGPSNLALAICLEEAAEEPGGRNLRRLFLESKPTSVWHPGMLLEDSLIQISVLKDLVTIRNPRSKYTFLNYLKTKGRLFQFLNLRDLFPTRIEFNDYLAWVAAELGQYALYGQQVVAVEPVPAPGGRATELLRVVSLDAATGARQERLARNVVLATGGAPVAPAGVELTAGGRAIHPHEFMQRLKRDFADKQGAHKFVVVGSGQSGAELFLYLMTHYPNADVTAAIRRLSYKPVDDSDFTNEIFFPEKVDFLFSLPDDKRAMVLDQCKDVNYAVVDNPLIHRIYRFLYQEKVEGRERARVRPFLELVRIEERATGAVAHFVDIVHDQPVAIDADAVVVATGYTWSREHPLLAPLAPFIERTAKGAFKVERDYRLATEPSFAARVYLQGFSEDYHGASEPVLSLIPVRAADILQSLLAAPPLATPAAEPSVLAAAPAF